MKQKQITLCGKTYPVQFNLNTMIKYERMLNRSFLLSNFDLLEEQIAVTVCAVFTANPDADLEADQIMQADSFTKLKELTDAYATVKEMILDFFKESGVTTEEPKAEEHEEHEVQPKN